MVVRSSGSLAHIYFNVTAERMDVSEIAILYPDLVDALVVTPASGWCWGSRSGRPVMVSPRGTAALTPDRLPPGSASREQTVADLARLLSFPHSGDLVLLGAWTGTGTASVVTFEDHAATHGGARRPAGLSLLHHAAGRAAGPERSDQRAGALPVFYRTVSGAADARPITASAMHQSEPNMDGGAQTPLTRNLTEDACATCRTPQCEAPCWILYNGTRAYSLHR